MPSRLNHIGIAAADVPALKRLLALLGLSVSHSEPVPDQGVLTHFVPLAGPAAPSLELLEPNDPKGTVAQFIAKRGPGIHHLSFEVGEPESGQLSALCERLKSEGYRLVYDSPRSGAHGMLINFIHPSSAGGMLIELMEKGRENPTSTGGRN